MNIPSHSPPLQIHPQDAPYARELANLIQQMVQIPMEKRPGSIQESRQQLLQLAQQIQTPGTPGPPSTSNAPASPLLEEDSIPEVKGSLCILQNGVKSFGPDYPCTPAWLQNSHHLIFGGFRVLECWDIPTQLAIYIAEITVTLLAYSLDRAFLALYERDNYDKSLSGHVFILGLRIYEQVLSNMYLDPSIDHLGHREA